MRPDIPFRQCCKCEYIEDCPHPDVDDEGKPIPPLECHRCQDVILTQRTKALEQKP